MKSALIYALLVTTGETLLSQDDADEAPPHEKSNSELARELLDKARGDIWDAENAKTDTDRAALRERARQQIVAARALFVVALREQEAAVQKFPLVLPATDKTRRRERAAAENQFLQSKLDLAETVYYEADTWDHGSEQRNQVLEKARNEFREIHKMHRAQVVGVIARLWEGKCLEEMDKIPEAIGIYDELLALSDSSERLKDLQSRALWFRLICLNHESRRDYRLVIDEGEPWRKQAGPAAQTEVGLGILFEVARAQELLGRDQTVPEAERNEHLARAREKAQVLARHEGIFQAPARALIKRVSARNSQ